MEQKDAAHSVRKQEITRCFYAALKSPVPLTTESLISVTDADRPIIMRAALDMLRFLRGNDIAHILSILALWHMQPYLERTIQKASKGRRIQAVTLLGYFTDHTSLDVLLHTMRDTNTYIQLAALRGLARRGSITHIKEIVASLTTTGQTNMLMLSDILQHFGTPAVAALIALANGNDINSEVRLAALIALGSIGSLEAVTSLITLTTDANEDIRAQAITALGKIGDARASAAIIARLNEDTPPVRIHAAKALGMLQPVAAIPALAAHLSDPDWWVRFRAAEALYHFGDKGIAALQSFSNQPNESGLMARQVLAEFGGAT